MFVACNGNLLSNLPLEDSEPESASQSAFGIWSLDLEVARLTGTM